MGTSKVYILDKYFNELQKFWDTEKRLQGNSHTMLKQQSVKKEKSDQLKVVSLFTLMVAKATVYFWMMGPMMMWIYFLQSLIIALLESLD